LYFPFSFSFFVFVSLYYYGHLRHLHSFPTRRSSDLKPSSDSRSSGCSRGLPPSGSRSATRWPSSRYACTSSATEPPARAPSARSDRKSTRLNSSHVAISYAVFCLKKKKHNLLLH